MLVSTRSVVSTPAVSRKTTAAEISSVGQRLALVLALDELGDEVVARVRAPLGDDRCEELLDLVPGR